MYQLLESIRCSDGKLFQLPYHQARVDQSFSDLFPEYIPPNLSKIRVPTNLEGLHKCRFLYGNSHFEYHFVPYSIRMIKTLRCVVSNDIVYKHKYLDRTEINQLSSSASDGEDVVIIRNGLITDSSYANLAFHDGLSWYTPSSFLLNGTKRQYLIDQGQLREMEIKIADLPCFEKVSLINALIDLDQISLPIDRIVK